MLVRTRSGALYLLDEEVMRLQRFSEQPIGGWDEPIAGDKVLDYEQPRAGERWMYRLAAGWFTSTEVVSVDNSILPPMHL